MKIKPSRIAARRMIVLQNFIAIITIFTAIILIPHYLGFQFNLEIMLGLLLLQFVVMIVATVYRLNKGHDGVLLRKWQMNKEGRLSEMKSNLRGIIENAQLEYYVIRAIVPEPKQMCVFRITFINQVTKKAMPIISLDRTTLTTMKINDFEVLCHAEKAVKADMEKLVFQSGKSELAIDNPYYMPENPPLTEIVWQCEGHTREKNIRINAKYFPNRHEDAAYPFYLFVNGQHLETCSGAYVPKEKSIIVGIGSVKKSDCIKRDCMLKASFDIRKKIPLPEPTVLLVNGSKVREVSFS